MLVSSFMSSNDLVLFSLTISSHSLVPSIKFFMFNSCVVYWRFFARRLFFAESFSYDHRIKKRSPRTPAKISIRYFSFPEIFTVSLTGSEPEMTLFWSYGCPFRNLEKSTKLSVLWNGVPVPSSRYLDKKCQSATQLLGGKKTTQMLKFNFRDVRESRRRCYWNSTQRKSHHFCQRISQSKFISRRKGSAATNR